MRTLLTIALVLGTLSPAARANPVAATLAPKAYANKLAREGNLEAIELADLACREARRRIEANFRNFFGADDGATYRVSQQVLEGQHAWLESGIVGMLPHDSSAAPKSGPVNPRKLALR